MIPHKPFDLRQAMEPQLVADVASVLDAEGIPHVLWGTWLLALYGVPTVIDVSF